MFPVKLRLLSELDIVKILTNTYYADCRHLTPPDEDALAARVDALAKKAKGEPWRASFSEDDMIDLKEYVTRNFRPPPWSRGLSTCTGPRPSTPPNASHPKIAPRCSKSCGTRPNRLRRSTCA